MIKLAAFDWNGTLAADAVACHYGFNAVLKAFGKKPISFRKWQQMFNVPNSAMYDNLGFKKDFSYNNAERISRIFLPEYERRAKNLRTRKGVKSTLKWLKKNKIPAIIFSNHTEESIKHHLNRLGIGRYIRAVLSHTVKTHGQVNRGRKKEFFLKDFVKKAKLKPSQVISVGDTEEEVEIGKAYGYLTAAITGGYNTTARLKKCHPDFLIHNMKDLVGIIKKLNLGQKT